MGYIFGFLIFNILMLATLTGLFPDTGLGRVFMFPMIVIINLGIVAMGIIISRYLEKIPKWIVWDSAILLNIFVALKLYPQEYNPPIITQMLNWF